MSLEYFIEAIFGLGLFLNAFLFIPQIIKLIKTKSAQGLSLLTFAGFNVIQIFTVLHGYLHKDFLLMWGYLLSILTCGTVTALILYRKNETV